MNTRMLVLAVVAFVAPAPAQSPATRSADVRWRPLTHTDHDFKPATYATREQWQARATWLREQVRFAAGLVPEPARAPLNARVYGRLERDGYTIEKVAFESRPGLWVTGNLYRPTNAKGRLPAVACPHGHWANGRLHHDDVGSIPARCITLAKLGAVVLAYDMIGYNDSAKQFDHRDPALSDPALALWGIGPLQLQTFNSVRVVDFLQSLPNVDPTRIGVTGASGGGTQTFILAALDDRVKVACPVNMVSHIMQGGCICENAPALRIDANNMEIAALFAPRPMLMVSATGDWTKDTPRVEFPFVRSIYDLLGAPDRVANVHIDAGHNYNKASREAMYRFLARRLLGRSDADSIVEGQIEVEKPEAMLAFADPKDIPADMPKLPALIERIKAADGQALARMETEQRAQALRVALSHAIGSSWPAASDVQRPPAARPSVLPTPVDELWFRAGRAARVVTVTSPASSTGDRSAILIHPAGAAVIHDDGGRLSDPSEGLPLVQRLAVRNRHVRVVEPFGFGDSRPPAPATKPANFDKFYTTFNRTDDAEAVYDILTVLAVELADPALDRVEITAVGRAGPLCLAALAMIPPDPASGREIVASIDLQGFDDSDAAYLKRLNLPNIRRIGGLPAITAVAATRAELQLHTAAEHAGG